MRPPTPVTTSIITSESGSTRISSETLNCPAPSQVNAVESSDRSSGFSPSEAMKAQSAPAKPTNTDAVEMIPACRRVMRVPASRIARKPPRGARRQIQPPTAIYPRSSLNVSTSRSSLRRAIATISPSPTHTSAAATAMTARAKT